MGLLPPVDKRVDKSCPLTVNRTSVSFWNYWAEQATWCCAEEMKQLSGTTCSLWWSSQILRTSIISRHNQCCSRLYLRRRKSPAPPVHNSRTGQPKPEDFWSTSRKCLRCSQVHERRVNVLPGSKSVHRWFDGMLQSTERVLGAVWWRLADWRIGSR